MEKVESNLGIFRRFLKTSSIYALANILRNVVGFIMLPIYTNYLTPEDYGIVSLMAFFVSVVGLILGARLGQAISKFYFNQDCDKERNVIVSTALIITVLISSLSTFFIIYFSTDFSELLFGKKGLEIVFILLSLAVIFQAMETTAMDYIRIKDLVGLYFGISIFKLIIQVLLNVLFLVVLTKGLLGISMASALSGGIVAGGCAIFVLVKVGIKVNRIYARQMVVFCWPLWVSGLVYLYIGSSNKFFLRAFSDVSDIGLLALAERFSGIIVMIVWQPIYQQWSIDRFRYKDHPNFQTIICLTYKASSLLLLTAGLGASLLSKPVITVMSDFSFHQAYLAVPALVLASIFYNLSSFYNFSFEVKDKTIIISYITYALAVVITAANFLAIPAYGFIGASCALLVTHLVRYILSKKMSDRYYKLNTNSAPVFISSLVFVGFCLLNWVFVGSNSLLSDFVVPVLLTLVYFVLTILIFFRVNEIKDFYNKVKAYCYG